MVSDAVCGWCGGYLASNRMIHPGTGQAYCPGCTAKAIRFMEALPGRGDALDWLARGSKEDPRNPTRGQIWVDTMASRPTPMMWDGRWWVDLTSGGAINREGEMRGRRFHGPTIKGMVLDEIGDFARAEPDPQALVVWTIYRNPSDFAGRMKGDVYVLRRWTVSAHSNRPDLKPVAWGTYDEVLDKVPPDLTCVKAGPGDDPAVLESWL